MIPERAAVRCLLARFVCDLHSSFHLLYSQTMTNSFLALLTNPFKKKETTPFRFLSLSWCFSGCNAIQ